MLPGTGANPQIQATGTIGASSTTAGRSESTLPLIAPLTRLPKVMWIAPPSTATDETRLLTIFSAGGKPAAALSDGKGCFRLHATVTAGFATSASGSASTVWSL